MAAQTSLSFTWSKTLKTGFLMTRLVFRMINKQDIFYKIKSKIVKETNIRETDKQDIFFNTLIEQICESKHYRKRDM